LIYVQRDVSNTIWLAALALRVHSTKQARILRLVAKPELFLAALEVCFFLIAISLGRGDALTEMGFMRLEAKSLPPSSVATSGRLHGAS
jgi:hypothetical protein